MHGALHTRSCSVVTWLGTCRSLAPVTATAASCPAAEAFEEGKNSHQSRAGLSGPGARVLLSKLQPRRAAAGVCRGQVTSQPQQQSFKGGEEKKKKLITSMTLTQPYLLQLSLCSWLLAKHKPELALQKLKRRPRNTMQLAVSVTPSEETISAPGSTESSEQGMLPPAGIHLVARHQVRAKRLRAYRLASGGPSISSFLKLG